MKRENIIHTKTYSFALRVIKLYKYLAEEKKEYVLSKQVLRSGTAIGALVKESEFAQSYKLKIKNAEVRIRNEKEYWFIYVIERQ